MFGDVAAHVGLVDEEGVDVSGADGSGAVAEDHAGGIFYAFDCEAEGGEAFEPAELAVKFLQGAGWVVLMADEVEVDAGGTDSGFGVGDAEDDYLVATLFETAGQGGHGIDVTCAGETECSEPCHELHPLH